jgi:DNA-binding transcriptional ArsR family regulator
MPEERITLDKDVFRTLASGTKVDILKSLDNRRKTLSELSKQLGMSVSTVKEHLDNMVRVGLIVQIDDGHKWKYYELTKKGKDILHPEDKKIWILLGISVLGIIIIGSDMLLGSQSYLMGAGAESQAMDALREGAKATTGSPAAVPAAPFLPYGDIAGLLVFGVLTVLSAIYIIRARRNIRI